MDLMKSMAVSASGLKAQSARMRVISENIANAQSVAVSAGADPYRRKIITFANELDKATGANTVTVKSVDEDSSAFNKRYDPGHPAANSAGYVVMPNVNSLIEMMDMRQAQRSYEANLNTIESAKQMMMRTVSLLQNQ